MPIIPNSMKSDKLKVAGWKSAKLAARRDRGFRKGRTGIEPALRAVEQKIASKAWEDLEACADLESSLRTLRTKAEDAVLDAIKNQKKQGNGSSLRTLRTKAKDAILDAINNPRNQGNQDQSTNAEAYVTYKNYINGIIESVDAGLNYLNNTFKRDTKSKRKRQPGDLTLDIILSNEKLFKIFRKYCVWSGEAAQIEFVKDMIRNKASQKIYDRYFAESANLRLNLSGINGNKLQEPWDTANESTERHKWRKVKAREVQAVVNKCKEMLEENALKTLKEGDDNQRLQIWVNRMCNA